MLDLLIKKALLPEGRKPVDIGIRDGLIVDIGEDIQRETRQTIHADGKVVFPSFANMHTHISMSLLRGLGADLPLMDWLQKVIWVLEGEFVSPEFVRDGALIGIAEAIRSGTTLFMDMYFFEEAVAEVAQRAGIRAGLGFGILDFPTKVAKSPEEYLQRAKAFIRECKQKAKRAEERLNLVKKAEEYKALLREKAKVPRYSLSIRCEISKA